MKTRRRSHERQTVRVYCRGQILIYLLYVATFCGAAPMHGGHMEDGAGAYAMKGRDSARFFSVLRGDPASEWEPTLASWGYLRSRSGESFGTTLSSKEISANLLAPPLAFVPTAGMVQASDEALYFAGLAGGSDIQVVRVDNSGRTIWSKSIGLPSPLNQVLALAIDSSDNVYVGGLLASGLAPDEDDSPATPFVPFGDTTAKAPAEEEAAVPKPATRLSSNRKSQPAQASSTARNVDRQAKKGGGAFVSCLDSAGNKAWTRVYGSAASSDVIRSLTTGTDTVFYAGGSVGESSPLLNIAENQQSVIRRPVFMGLEKATGLAIFTNTPEPIEPGVDEEITAVANDKAEGTVFAGGSMGGKFGTLYKFEGKEFIASFKMKAEAPVAALATSKTTSAYFITVGGCVLNRITNSGTTFVEIPLELRDIGGDKSCFGDAVDVAYRKADNNAAVLVTGAGGAPELLFYSDNLRGVIGRVQGKAGLAENLKGLVVLADDETSLFGGSVSSTGFLGGAVLEESKVLRKVAEAAAKHNSVDMALYVKIAALGGSAAVLVGGLIAIVVVVQYTKRTGEPA